MRTRTATAAALLVAALGLSSLAGDQRVDDEDVRKKCRANLLHIGQALRHRLDYRHELGPGAAAWVMDMTLHRDNALQLRRDRLTCVADPLRRTDESDERIRGLISYAIRDSGRFPYDEDSKSPQVLAVCPHHDDGAFVLTDDVKVQFVSRADLEIAGSAPLQVGPNAADARLQVVTLDSEKLDGIETPEAALASRLMCEAQIKALVKRYGEHQIEQPGRPKYSGPSLLLSYVEDGTIGAGQEGMLRCPSDSKFTELRGTELSARYAELDLVAPPPRDLISYAVRDFKTYPLVRETQWPQIIIACRHHSVGLVVGYDDLSTKFMKHEHLGLTRSAEIRIGPEASVEMLSYLLRPEDVVEKDD